MRLAQASVKRKLMVPLVTPTTTPITRLHASSSFTSLGGLITLIGPEAKMF